MMRIPSSKSPIWIPALRQFHCSPPVILVALLVFAACILPRSGHAIEVTEVDVCVYGGASGGVTAAVQAARMGKSVVLVSPTKHLGGLTSSGLGWTDLGNSSILGGLSREFYHRVYLHYQNDAAWTVQTQAQYGNNGQGGPAFNHTTQIASVFEPKVAEAIFEQLIQEHGVPIIRGRMLLTDGVVKDGQRIKAMRLENGREIRAKMFIDATYEGDLMAKAGVRYFVGREPNSQYGET
ncbi:MAG: FAD-dependent oxidoreductase, partial [Verrucomicrobiaceae bacterium]